MSIAEPTEWTVPVDIGGGWVVDATIAIIGGRPQMVAMTYRSHAGDLPVRAKAVRAINVGAVAVEAIRVLVEAGTIQMPPPAAPQEPGERRGPGRPPVYGIDHFKKVADLYRQALFIPGWKRRPVAYVGAEMGVCKSTASNWVEKARNHYGLLPTTTRGVIG